MVVVALAVLTAAGLLTFVVQAFYVPSGLMLPTLKSESASWSKNSAPRFIAGYVAERASSSDPAAHLCRPLSILAQSDLRQTATH
jgi:hypothetical protein